MQEAVIIDCLRTAVGKSGRGAFRNTRPDDMAAAIADCEVFIVRNRTQVRGALLDACKVAKVIGRLGVGLDNIDVPGCEARGMTVIPATGANALAVAEYVIVPSAAGNFSRVVKATNRLPRNRTHRNEKEDCVEERSENRRASQAVSSTRGWGSPRQNARTPREQ